MSPPHSLALSHTAVVLCVGGSSEQECDSHDGEAAHGRTVAPAQAWQELSSLSEPDGGVPPGLIVLLPDLPYAERLSFLTHLKASAKLRRIPVVVLVPVGEENLTVYYDLYANLCLQVHDGDGSRVVEALKVWWFDTAQHPLLGHYGTKTSKQG